MIINTITLRNFRIYKGEHTISFAPTTNKNVFIISGDNGFGKTTILTSLIWTLYGKLMTDVDEKFKKEITDSFGYKNFAAGNLNKLLRKKGSLLKINENDKKRLIKNGYPENDPQYYEIRNLNEYSVTLVISDVFLPSIPCELVTITRSYDVLRGTESVQILVDGKENELTKEVGPDIFINDFILPREIAKFFFFDSEKIVSMAEMNTLEDKRKLSLAYSEVLGIKKYEDLKTNLENIRIKLRRKSADVSEKEKLNKLVKECSDLDKLIDHLKSQQVSHDIEILNKRQQSEQYQEKLIREGNKISVSELLNLKALRDELKERDITFKNKLKELLDLAPFAIAGEKLVKSFKQMVEEQKHSGNNDFSSTYNDRIKKIQSDLDIKIGQIPTLVNNEVLKKVLKDVFNDNLFTLDSSNSAVKVLFDFTPSEQNEFKSIYENIKYSYSQVFKQLVKDTKNNQIFLSKTIRKITQAESNENDLLIKEIRSAKVKVDKSILDLDKENRKISEEIGSYQKELSNKNKVKAELTKRVQVDESDKTKDQIAERLITELEEFLLKLKNEKKESLALNIKHELNKLMHKTDFIHHIKVEILDDVIDIKLFDNEDIEINKDSLSKGEQQLYATAILKALVDESEVKFPVFIDSPLQKFDKRHSNKIITEFYPTVAEQVVIFPLLEKELSESEYRTLLPNIQSTYIIQNDSKTSNFVEVSPYELF